MWQVRPRNSRSVTVTPPSARYSSRDWVTEAVYGVTRAMRRAPISASASSRAPEVVTAGISPAWAIAAHMARSPARPPTKLPEVQA